MKRTSEVRLLRPPSLCSDTLTEVSTLVASSHVLLFFGLTPTAAFNDALRVCNKADTTFPHAIFCISSRSDEAREPRVRFDVPSPPSLSLPPPSSLLSSSPHISSPSPFRPILSQEDITALLPAWQAQLPKLRGVFYLSCKTGESVEQLLAALDETLSNEQIRPLTVSPKGKEKHARYWQIPEDKKKK